MVLKYIGSQRSIFSDLNQTISDFWWTGPTNWPTNDWIAPFNPSNSLRHAAQNLVDRFANYYGFPVSGGLVINYGIDASFHPSAYTSVFSSYGYSCCSEKINPSNQKVKYEIDNGRPIKGGYIGDQIYGTHAVCIIGYSNDGSISTFWDTYDITYTKVRSTSTFNNLVCIYPDVRIPDDVSSLEAATSLVRPGERILVTSNIVINNNITIASNITLTINKGLTLKFASGKKLTINGILQAIGTSSQQITFQANSGMWYGIEFNHANSGSQVKYCNIRDAQYGIYMIHTNVFVTGNTIEQNATGLLFEDYADGASIVNQNGVKFNSSYGIRCKTYSDPLLFSCNVIRENGYGYGGVCGDATSVFDLGRYSDQGHNSIYNNDPYEVNSSYPGTIYARYNWWGSASPSPLVTANVNWQYHLTSDPNPGLLKELFQQTPLENNPAPTITASDTVGMAAVNAAYEIYRKGDYQTAAGMFEAIIDKYSGHFAGRRALASYYKCQQYLQNDATGLARLEAISRNYPGQELAAVANHLIAGESIRQGDYTSAITRCQEQATQFAATDYRKYAFYRLGTIYWYFLNDPKTGDTYYRQLIAAYPDDDLAISALATLDEWKPEAPQKRLPAVVSNSFPVTFALFQNYPNPFNPITTIRYQLPETVPVTLKIYNLLGAEIQTIAHEIQSAGCYSLNWQGVDQCGQPVPNGVYWLRLEAGRFNAQRKLVLLK